MTATVRESRRLIYLAVALAVIATAMLPVLSRRAFAYGQMEPREVKMSSAVPAATGVSYAITFTPVTTSQELIIDFCSDTPIIGTVASPSPCSFSAASVPDVSPGGTDATCSSGTVTILGTGTPKHTIEITGLTMTGGSPFTITCSGIKNPTNSTVGSNMTFYARILTYGTGNASEYTAANVSGGNTAIGADVVDAGGAALSTTITINLTAKVQEQLTFCTSGADLSATDCTGATAPNLTLGHNNGSGTLILDSSQVDTTPAFTQLSSNATTGVIVRMKDVSSTTCGGLSDTGGSTCNIPAEGATPTALTPNTAAFGMCVAPATGNTVAETAYTDSTGGCATSAATSKVGLDQSTANNNVLSTYGSSIFHTTGAIHKENDRLTFAATAADTTPAGIYTVSESLIATGTF